MVQRFDNELDEVRSDGQFALEEPHHDHVVSQSHGVSVESAEEVKRFYLKPSGHILFKWLGCNLRPISHYPTTSSNI